MTATSAEIASVLDRFAAGPVAFARAVAAVPAELRDKKPAPGKWSVRENVIHLAEAELFYATRIRTTLAEENPPLRAWDQDVYAANLRHADQDLDVALDLLDVVRRSTLGLLRTVPPSAYDRTALHSEKGKLTLFEIVTYAAGHPYAHVAQVERTLAALRTQKPAASAG